MTKKDFEPNRLFWDARMALGLSRPAVADIANGQPVMSTCEHEPMNENYIGRIEQGRIGGGMCVERRSALCAALGVQDPAQIGLIVERRRPTRLGPTRTANPGNGLRHRLSGDSPADKANHVPVTMEESPLSSAMNRGRRGNRSTEDRLAELSVDTPPPENVSWNDVDHVRFITRALALSENTFGGGFSGEAAAAQLRYSARLLDARANNAVRRAMFEAVGNLGGVVGFSLFDVANHRSAKVCFEFELWCSEQAQSWGLRASALSDLARLAIYLGNVDEALFLIELAQVRSDRLTDTTCAMLSAVRSRLLALSGRYEEAKSELARSDEYFANRDPTADPPWMSYYDEAEHQGSTGRALVPIAIKSSDPCIAATRMQRAIAMHDNEHPRSRALSRTRLASLLMKVGDPREAVSAGRISLEEASAVNSTRLRAELERLAATAARHRRIPEVAELVRDITAPRLPDSAS